LFIHYGEPHEFSPSEIKMLSLFANKAALAIQNARQREDLETTEKVAWAGITFSTLAHRITQKSAAIRNTVWGLRRQLDTAPGTKERLDSIDENAQYLNTLAKEVVKESFDERLQTVDFNQLLRNEIPRWHGDDDKVSIDLDPTAAYVLGDPTRLAVVIEFLTTNAVRAMRKTPERGLVVKSTVHEQHVEVTMTNTGAIPEHVRPLLFQQPIPTEDGMGIGLLIVHYVLRRYGGNIELLPSPPGTSSFSLSLPIHQGQF
jgi:C4-dicarboxylate-specific signal transduction histidine kinase